MAAGCGSGCRKKPAPAAAGRVISTAEQSIEGSWTGVFGGALSFPEPGTLRLASDVELSAAKWTGQPLPRTFKIVLEARRIDGADFFCGLTFPARASGECLTWIVGGWGGSLVGISSIDGRDASENETTRSMVFEKGRWYRLELSRDGERVEAWIDGVKVVDLDTTGKTLSLRPGSISSCAPFGLATWQSAGEFKGLRCFVPCG